MKIVFRRFPRPQPPFGLGVPSIVLPMSWSLCGPNFVEIRPAEVSKRKFSLAAIFVWNFDAGILPRKCPSHHWRFVCVCLVLLWLSVYTIRTVMAATEPTIDLLSMNSQTPVSPRPTAMSSADAGQLDILKELKERRF